MRYQLTKDYNDILEDVLKNEPILEHISDAGIAVGIVASKVEKRKQGGIIYADCRKVPEYWKTFTPYDFLVTIYEPNCEGMNPDQLRVLMIHELMHIGVKPDDLGKTFIRDHDLQDFRYIVETYGVDWNRVK